MLFVIPWPAPFSLKLGRGRLTAQSETESVEGLERSRNPLLAFQVNVTALVQRVRQRIQSSTAAFCQHKTMHPTQWHVQLRVSCS